MFCKSLGTALVLVLVFAHHAQAQEVIFFEDFDPVRITPSNTPVQNSNRRAGIDLDNHFAGRWLLNTSGGFGGIDIGINEDSPGLIAVSGVTTMGVAFDTLGSLGPDNEPNTGDDLLPTGAFPFITSTGGEVPAGTQIGFSFELGNNVQITQVDWQIGLLLDGAPLPSDTSQSSPGYALIGSGTVTDFGPFDDPVLVAGAGILPESASTFNPVIILDNTQGKAHLDNITLTIGGFYPPPCPGAFPATHEQSPSPSLPPLILGDVQDNGIIDFQITFQDFLAIATNFGATGFGRIDGDALGAADGIVDIDDFILWKKAFELCYGQHAATVAPVPEPGALGLLIVAAGMAVWPQASVRRR